MSSIGVYLKFTAKVHTASEMSLYFQNGEMVVYRYTYRNASKMLEARCGFLCVWKMNERAKPAIEREQERVSK